MSDGGRPHPHWLFRARLAHGRVSGNRAIPADTDTGNGDTLIGDGGQNIDEMEREMRNSQGEYRCASLIRLTMADPVNDLDEGTEMVVEGRCEDGIAHTVLDRDTGDIVAVECEVVERYVADSWMSKSDIKDWGAEQVRDDLWPENGEDYSDSRDSDA